ncbi:MAG TPA: hypothetical protein VNJ52_04980 [Patescibacteria group bacterium]|nr:hypothetical protein [Patescibacteria group bacterium]
MLAFVVLALGLHEEDEHPNEPHRLRQVFFPRPLHLAAEENGDLFGIFDAAVKGEIAAPRQFYFAV